MINLRGERFVREDVGPSELASDILAQPGGTAFEVYDQSIHDLAMAMGAYRESVDRGATVTASTPDELARRLEIPVETFRATLDKANAAAHGEIADPLERRAYGKPLQPPVWGVRVIGALAHTQGGLLVNDHAHVVREDGSSIAGLLELAAPSPEYPAMARPAIHRATGWRRPSRSA